jgi:hypothetical protein
LFRTIGIRLLSGRAFADADRADSQLVAIVNETFVRKFLSDRDPMHEQLRGANYHIVNGRAVLDNIQIVGVASDVKYATLTAAPSRWSTSRWRSRSGCASRSSSRQPTARPSSIWTTSGAR